MTAKQWLSRYYDARQRIQSYELQIEELETIAEGGAINIKPTPGAKNRNRSIVEESVAKIADLMTEIDKQKEKQAKVIVEITNAINAVEDSDQHTILTMRYIGCMKWEDIIASMHYERASVFEKHDKALQSIAIPD